MVTLSGTNIAVKIDGHAILEVERVKATPGRILALTGESGSGKTTLLNVLGLLVKPDAGVLTIDDKDVGRWREARKQKFWREKTVFIFQDYGLIDEETIAYNLTLRRYYFSKRGRQADAHKVENVLQKVGLSGRSMEIAAGLSGGEKQRLGFARALFREAKLVLADEPTASLDSKNQQLILDLLRQESERGATVIVATHDAEVVKICDDVLTTRKPKSHLLEA